MYDLKSVLFRRIFFVPMQLSRKNYVTLSAEFFFRMMVRIRLVVKKIMMWAGIVFMVCLTFSCEEFCEEMNRTAIVVNIDLSENEDLTTVRVSIKGIENDSVLYSQTSNSQVLLPINPTENFMSFSIEFDGLPADTIIFHYSRHNGFVSSECGCVTHAELSDDSARTENSIRRMVISNRKVTTVSYRRGIVNEENVRIYY